MTTLVIVESEGKVKKIQSCLGKGHIVMSSAGIIQDLHEKKLSIDIENNFKIEYVITKPQIVARLKSAMAKADMLYIASDGDREGERIGESYKNILKPKKYKRLVFRDTSKTAILNSVKNAGELDYDMINSQKGRRVLDKIFGAFTSKIICKQVVGGISAGRTQTPALRMICDKEREIDLFINKNQDSNFFKFRGIFSGLKATMYTVTKKESPLQGKISQITLPEENVINILKQALKSVFTIKSVIKKTATRKPAPPFSTDTMQQEAYRKLGMKIDDTMKYAQKLYEAGYITYMRTDSVEIPDEKMKEIKDVVIKEFGKEYYQENIYKNGKDAQEAHSAILCVKPDLMDIDVPEAGQVKLYKLIWQRMIASQMKDAKIDVTIIQIIFSKNDNYYFQGQIEKVIFQGFMKVYIESVDDEEDNDTMENFKGKFEEGTVVIMEEIVAKQEYLRPPYRYSEASLVKELKKNKIGRPATYGPTVKKNLERKYIKTVNVPGVKKPSKVFSIRSKQGKHIMNIEEEESTITIGQEKNKLIPTEAGMNVIKFMEKHFLEFIEYGFTAKMEADLDKIAKGKKVWQDVVRNFYEKFNPVVETLTKLPSIAKASEKIIGTYKGVQITATLGPHGPYIKRVIDGKNVCSKIREPYTLENINLEGAIELIENPPAKKNFKSLVEFDINGGKARVIEGEHGPYNWYTKGTVSKNFRINRDVDLNNLTKDRVKMIMDSYKNSDKKPVKKRASGSKTSSVKTPRKRTTK